MMNKILIIKKRCVYSLESALTQARELDILGGCCHCTKVLEVVAKIGLEKIGTASALEQNCCWDINIYNCEIWHKLLPNIGI